MSAQLHHAKVMKTPLLTVPTMLMNSKIPTDHVSHKIGYQNRSYIHNKILDNVIIVSRLVLNLQSISID